VCGDIKIDDIAKEPTTLVEPSFESERIDALEARIAALEARLGIG
jgi:hypothetical protein